MHACVWMMLSWWKWTSERKHTRYMDTQTLAHMCTTHQKQYDTATVGTTFSIFPSSLITTSSYIEIGGGASGDDWLDDFNDSDKGVDDKDDGEEEEEEEGNRDEKSPLFL